MVQENESIFFWRQNNEHRRLSIHSHPLTMKSIFQSHQLMVRPQVVGIPSTVACYCAGINVTAFSVQKFFELGRSELAGRRKAEGLDRVRIQNSPAVAMFCAPMTSRWSHLPHVRHTHDRIVGFANWEETPASKQLGHRLEVRYSSTSTTM